METISCKCKRCKTINPAGLACHAPSTFLDRLRAEPGHRGWHHLVATAHGSDAVSRIVRECHGLVAI